MRKTGRQSISWAAAALILFAAGHARADAVASQASAPTSTVADEITSILNDPDSLVGTLAHDVPELRSAMETRLRDAAEAEGIIGLRDEAFRIGWEYGQRYMARFADRADGQALLDFLTSLKAVVTKMDSVGSVQCYDSMFGAKPLNVASSGVTVADVKAVNDAIIAVIRTGAAETAQPAPKAPDALVSQVATRAYAAAKGYESGWALLSDPQKAGNDHDKAAVCKDVSALYGEILSLPKGQAIAVARVLFSTKKAPQ
jgi:hypothetical protein